MVRYVYVINLLSFITSIMFCVYLMSIKQSILLLQQQCVSLLAIHNVSFACFIASECFAYRPRLSTRSIVQELCTA